MFHANDNSALIEWPFVEWVDNSILYRNLAYDNRLEMISALIKQNVNILAKLSVTDEA